MNAVKKIFELKKLTLKRYETELEQFEREYKIPLSNINENRYSPDDQIRISAKLQVAAMCALFIHQIKILIEELAELETKYDLNNPDSLIKTLENADIFTKDFMEILNKNRVSKIILDEEASKVINEILHNGGSYSLDYRKDLLMCEELCNKGLISQETKESFVLTYSNQAERLKKL